MLRNRVITLRFRLCVTEAFCEQLAGAFHCVLLLCNMVTTVIEQAGEWFAGGLPVHAVLYTVCQARYQRGAFDQPLRVDYGVVTLRLHRIAEGFALGFNRCGKPRFTPAADGHRDHAVDRFVPGRDLRETLFHHPVKTNARNGPHGVRQRRKRMQHITHRRGFNDQYPHSLSFFAQQQFVEFFENALRRDVDQALVITLRGIAFTHLMVTRDQTNNARLI